LIFCYHRRADASDTPIYAMELFLLPALLLSCHFADAFAAAAAFRHYAAILRHYAAIAATPLRHFAFRFSLPFTMLLTLSCLRHSILLIIIYLLMLLMLPIAPFSIRRFRFIFAAADCRRFSALPLC